MDPTALASQITQLDQGYNPTDVYNKITTSLGIPDARTRVQALQKNLIDTQNAIESVDPSVTGRTSNALVTEAQRQRLVNTEKQPLNETYTKQNQSFGVEQGNLSSLTSQATQQAGLAESNYKVKRQSLADQLTAALRQQETTRAEAQHQADQAFTASENAKNRSASAAKSSSKSSSATPTPDDIIKYFITTDSKYGAYNPNTTNYHRWQAAEQELKDAGFNPEDAKIKKLTTAAFGSPAERKALGV